MKDLKSQFVDWVATKPADEEYNYDCNLCAFGSFLLDIGIPFFTMYDTGWNEGETGIDPNPTHAFTPEFTAALIAYPRTFGALRERLVQS